MMATDAPTASKLLSDCPAWKKKALEKIEYGSIISVNLFFDQIPWKRFTDLLVEDLIFSGVIDTTYLTDTSGEEQTGPKILNMFMSTPPTKRR
ncbi:MAG: FAD-dependent oxidoreductase [Proteobacteria bacterium]|nr:FAD-dependent oxidoreductase [Pseudomonadota bacterium]